MVDGLVAFHADRYQASGAELIMGSGRLVAPKTMEVALNDGGTRVIAADKLFLNVGTHASIPPVSGLQRRTATDAHRGARSGPASWTSDRAGRRLRRSRAWTGVSAFWEPCHGRRARLAAGGSRRSGRVGGGRERLAGGRRRVFAVQQSSSMSRDAPAPTSVRVFERRPATRTSKAPTSSLPPVAHRTRGASGLKSTGLN